MFAAGSCNGPTHGDGELGPGSDILFAAHRVESAALAPDDVLEADEERSPHLVTRYALGRDRHALLG